jgi:cold shock CspA family protein
MSYMMGEVLYYDLKRGFGYIKEVGPNALQCFFHINQVAGKTILEPRDLVVFRLHPNPYKPGRIEATDVRFLKHDSAPAASVTEGGQS